MNPLYNAFKEEKNFDLYYDYVTDYKRDLEVRGLYYGEIKLIENNLDTTVLIGALNLTITAPLAYSVLQVNVGDIVPIWLDSCNTGKIIGTSINTNGSSLQDYGSIVSKDGTSKIIVSNFIELITDSTRFQFKFNKLNILSPSFFNIFIPSYTELHLGELSVIGASIDVRLGSILGAMRSLPFSSVNSGGLSVTSLFGNIEFVSTLGSVNIISYLAVHIQSFLSADILAPIISFTGFVTNPVVAFGFGMILPSPGGLAGLPSMLNLTVNPFRMPLPDFLNTPLSVIRRILP